MRSLILLCLTFLMIVRTADCFDDAFAEFKIQRKEVFEFTKKPKLVTSKNSASISFAVKDYCDVTIAIENADGKIIRHLASGVLGKNAPEPFVKDSLEQTIIWDILKGHDFA